jgi:VCBS repeat-containing protein
VNDAPFTKGGSLLVGEDDSQSGMLTAGDPDGDPLIFVILDQPQHGTLSDFNASTGEYTYTPDADYYGKDAFTYQVSDGQAESNVGVVSIAVTPVNDAPAANDDSLSLNEDGSQSGTLTATDVDGDTLTYAIVEQPQHGALSDFNASTGAYTYTPNADFNGTDSFTFKANDGTLDSNIATIGITINPVNDRPVLTGGGSLGTIAEDTPAGSINGVTVSSLLSGKASDVDGDTLGIAVIGLGNPAKGTYQYSMNGGSSWVTIASASVSQATLLSASALLRFVPKADVNGPIDVYYVAWDGTYGNAGDQVALAASTGPTAAFSQPFAKATLTITPVNDAPVLTTGTPRSFGSFAEDTGPANKQGATVSSLISGRASDVDGDTLGIAIVSVGNPAKGTYQYSLNNGSTWLPVGSVSETNALLLGASAKVRFVPNANFNGTVDLYYRAWDKTQGSEGAKLNLSGKIGDTGTASVVFQKATCTVTPVNDAPVLVTGTPRSFGTIAEDTAPASIPGAMVGSLISGRASDVDGDALGIAIISVGQPGKGTYQYSVNGGSTWLNVDSVSESNALLLSSSAKVRFLPNADFNGTVDLYFRAWDGTQGAEGTKLNLSGKIGSPGTASVVFDKATCTVTPVNDAPQFTPQSYGPIGYVRGQAAGPAVFPDITVKDVDNTDFRRGVLQVTGLQSGDAISASGRFSFAGQFVLYTPDNQAAIQLGTRSGGAGSDLTITLSDNANPSQDLVQRLIRSFRFTSTGNAGARNLSLTLTDTAGDASNSVTRTVNVS